MDKEERAFRRMITRAVVAGPEKLTRDEIHASLGISKNMVADARKAEAEEKQRMIEARDAGRRLKSRCVTSALERRRKTTKFAEMRQKVKAFYIARSTPTSRRRDVMKCWVSRFCSSTVLLSKTCMVHQLFLLQNVLPPKADAKLIQ